MKDIVIIPIREHSKGVRNKNIFLFNNNLTSLEMINKELNKFDKKNIDVFVNTESQLFKLLKPLELGLQYLPCVKCSKKDTLIRKYLFDDEKIH